MCGITALISLTKNKKISYTEIVETLQTIRYRGPDNIGIYNVDEYSYLGHVRLGIVGNTKQPIHKNNCVLVCNGEIYNYKKLVKDNNFTEITDGDCEVIIDMYLKYDIDCVKQLDGIYSFVLYDKLQKRWIISRDMIGVTSLYIGRDENSIIVSSEMKNIRTKKIEQFKNGNVMVISEKSCGEYNMDMLKINCEKTTETREEIMSNIRNLFVKSVAKRLMCDVDFGVLLSGGLDSSLVASVTSKLLGKRIKTYTIGIKDSPDIICAEKVAEYLNSDHTSYLFTPEEGIEAIHDIIYYLETYDVTTIRASTPMYLLTKKIKKDNIKMILSGEGSDELFGGYLYFKNAPSEEEFENEIHERVINLRFADCLRAHKSCMANAIECRVPFLDKEFVNYTFKIPTHYKRTNIEKLILRDSFIGFLPDDILYREKEQFSDGVGYSWITSLKSYIDSSITDEQFKRDSKLYSINTPTTKEALFYRNIYDKLFKDTNSNIIKTWTPKWVNNTDPSGVIQKQQIKN